MARYGGLFHDRRRALIRIATWNVNSIKAHIVNVTSWLREAKYDVVLMQEIKTTDEGFPRLELEDLGYNLAIVGQKTYNGVAILSKHPIAVELTALPGDESDAQARYLEALVDVPANGRGRRTMVRVASIYLPNGNPVGTEKFSYKLAWMDRLRSRAKELLKLEEMLVLAGDYNVAPTDMDVHDSDGNRDDALCRPESRQRFRALVNLGFTDALRALHNEPHLYTYWDYMAGRWQKDEGWRIDHLLLSPQAADRLSGSGVDREPRGAEKPSDHTPTWCDLDI
jgi:exodeoxyribonuclease-3